MSDRLDGFRGEGPSSDGLSPQEVQLQRFLQENSGLINLVAQSAAVSEWLKTPAGEAVYQSVARDVEDAFMEWSQTDDPASDAAIAAHRKVRVALAVMDRIGAVISVGRIANVSLESNALDEETGE